MGKEIERKFLVNSLQFMELAEGVLYEQGYISLNKERIVRVRTEGNRGVVTFKGLKKGYTRTEFEYEVPVEDVRVMLQELCIKPIIKKYRYKVPFENKLWEVDVFKEENEGLIVAEVELNHEQEAFKKPSWVAEEVTGDSRYGNSELVKRPYSTW